MKRHKPYWFDLKLRLNELSYKNELSLVWKLLKRSFKWDQARFCSSIRLGAALNWIIMVRDDKCYTDVSHLAKAICFVKGRFSASTGWISKIFRFIIIYMKTGKHWKNLRLSTVEPRYSAFQGIGHFQWMSFIHCSNVFLFICTQKNYEKPPLN